MANKKVTPLTDTEIKNSKPTTKDYTLSDGSGLQLVVKADGRKIWEIRYTFDGKARKTTAGAYPIVTLKDARAARDLFRSKVSLGIDPIKEKQEVKSNLEEEIMLEKLENTRLLNTFEKVARDYFASVEGELNAQYHSKKVLRLEKHIFPYIGKVPMDEITRIMVIECIDRIKQRGHVDNAKRLLNIVGQVFRYAVTRELAPHNIIADIDKRYVIGRIESKNYPTITDPKEIGKLLRAIDEYHGEITVRYALKLAILTSQRPFNIRFAEWNEFDLAKNEWNISSEKMKMKRPHFIPITKQIKELLEELAVYSKDRSKYLFPALHTNMKPISENTLNQALRRLGYSKEEIVSHGFRAMFSTIANENIPLHGYHTDVIERHLAHAERNKVKGAYNHAEYTDQRIGLVKWWNDYLEELKNTVTVSNRTF